MSPTCLRGLGASNGRQDHTVLPYADPSSPRGFAGPVTLPTKFWRRRKQRRSSCALLFAHGRPPFEQASRARRSRVHRIPHRVRDDRDPPLWGMRWRELIAVICPTGPAEYFCERDWTTQITLKSLRKSKFTRSGFFGPIGLERRRMQADLPRRYRTDAGEC